MVDPPMFNGGRPVKPVGSHPRTFGGITIRRTAELPPGVQALWREGHLLGVFEIGEPIPNLRVDNISLNPLDYEKALMDALDVPAKDRRREWKGRRRPFRGANFDKMLKDKLNA